VEPKLA